MRKIFLQIPLVIIFIYYIPTYIYITLNFSFIAEFTWTRACTLLLISLYEERKYKFRDPKIKNKNIWMEILEKFKRKGYIVDINTIDRKFRNLKKKTYKAIKDNKSKNRTGRGRVTWDYYDEMDTIFVDDQSVNPQYTLSSSDPPEDDSLPSTSEHQF